MNENVESGPFLVGSSKSIFYCGKLFPSINIKSKRSYVFKAYNTAEPYIKFEWLIESTLSGAKFDIQYA